MTKSKSVFNRFLKAFIAGGISSASVFLANGVTFSTIAEAKALLISFSIAIFSGAIMALEKAITWTDEPKS